MNYNSEEDNYIQQRRNAGYEAAGALQIRLNTEPLLEEFEMNLRGYQTNVGIDSDGNPVMKNRKISEPLANDLGISRIMNIVRSMINPQVVQGNFDNEMYNDYLYSYRRQVATNLMVNLKRYGVHPSDYKAILLQIWSIVEPYLSRTIGNKERESYAQTIKSVESSSQQVKGGGLRLNPFTA